MDASNDAAAQCLVAEDIFSLVEVGSFANLLVHTNKIYPGKRSGVHWEEHDGS